MKFCFQDIPKINPLSALPSLIVRINLPHLGEMTCRCFHQNLWYWFLESPSLRIWNTHSNSAYEWAKGFGCFRTFKLFKILSGKCSPHMIWLPADYQFAKFLWYTIKERCQPISSVFSFAVGAPPFKRPTFDNSKPDGTLAARKRS